LAISRLAHLQGFGDFGLGEEGSVIAFDQQGHGRASCGSSHDMQGEAVL
jgi:hypothetical protein